MPKKAYRWCSALEEACKIIYYTRMFELHKATCPKVDVSEYRKHSDEYKKGDRTCVDTSCVTDGTTAKGSGGE